MAKRKGRLVREVKAQDALGFGGVARLQGGQNLAMFFEGAFAGLAPLRLIFGVAADERQGRAVVERRQAGHVGGIDQCFVESPVCLQNAEGIISFHEAGEFIACLCHRRQGGVGSKANFLDCQALKREPELGNFGQVGRGESRNKIACSLAAVDEPLGLKPCKCLAQGRAVNLQSLRPLRLAEALPRLDLLKDEQAANGLISLIALRGDGLVGGDLRHCNL